MESFPLVTVITVTFNIISSKREDFLRENICSVKNQSYPNIEHLFIDGASTDGTLDYLKQYERDGVIRVISEEDLGIYDAMNKGHRFAKGNFVLVLNSDDSYAYPGAVYDLMNAIQSQNADYAFGDQFCIRPNNTRYLDPCDTSRFWQRMPFNHPTILIKKNIVEELGFYSTDFDTVADYKFVIDLILNDYKGVGVKKPIVNFRLGGASYDEKTLLSKYWSSYIKLPKLFSWFYSKFDDRMTEEFIIQGFMLETRGNYDEEFLENLVIFMLKKNLKNFDYDSFLQRINLVKNQICNLHDLEVGSKTLSLFGVPFLTIKYKSYGKRIKLFGIVPLFQITNDCKKYIC